jgi:hypothetical protein
MALSVVQQTDTTFAVDGATLLDYESLAGSVVVNVWNRNEVRVQAEHSRGMHLDIRHRGGRISVEPESERGPAGRADVEITVPAGMDVKIESFMGEITVNGVQGNVEAETLEGDVTVRGGQGAIKVASMSGRILVEDAHGEIDVESAAREVRIVNSSGRIVGETMGGAIVFENVNASSVDVGSVGGFIWYDGTFQPGGTYFFGTHGGFVTLVIPEGASAQFDLSTFHGQIEDNLDGENRIATSRDGYTLQVGAGEAIVEAETFGGRISVLRKGTEGEIPEVGEAWDGISMGLDVDLSGLEGLGDVLGASVGAALDIGLSAADFGAWAREWEHELEMDRAEAESVHRRIRHREPGGGR